LRDNIIYELAFCFAEDKFLADTNTVGTGSGQFDNSKDMALNLSFKGYCLGGYVPLILLYSTPKRSYRSGAIWQESTKVWLPHCLHAIQLWTQCRNAFLVR
jgi:hypothetical protein